MRPPSAASLISSRDLFSFPNINFSFEPRDIPGTDFDGRGKFATLHAARKCHSIGDVTCFDEFFERNEFSHGCSQ